MSFEITSRLKSHLERDRALYGGVLSTISEFEPWIAANDLFFFPEYTDHGLNHLRDVLATSEALIRDDAWPAITAVDAAVLTLSVLLHDCAMHLSADGFITLISPATAYPIVSGFGDAEWPSLWHSFLAEARRFDGRKLMGLFGSTKPVTPPPLEPSELTLRDRQFIGEFLRRHHHRLAHEIAVNGVPGPPGPRLQLVGIPREIADLAGIVARSHGLPLRACVPYLKDHYDIREFRGVHAVFLMGVLRVADYLQVQSARAPRQALLVRKLRSPASVREWQAHAAIRDIRHTHEDPEAVFIDAEPKNVTQFLRIKDWQFGIQGEMDASWAVFGEIYGRYNSLSSLGLVLRRVRTSLDDIQRFAGTVSYIPVRAAFEAADADLLKLLVSPLYGDRPAIGIRELVQNAVDAVRELRAYNLARGVATDTASSGRADVIIAVEQLGTDWWVSVSDRGIGMRASTITDYFLRAGASYRRSYEWQELFEDEAGHSRVLRSGRFGVGALAAFLLGNEITVATRHVDEPEDAGIIFTATIDTEAVELRRTALPSGTEIRIRVSESTAQRLLDAKGSRTDVSVNRESRLFGTLPDDWDWYCLDDPKVVRTASGLELRQVFSLPSQGGDLPTPWRRILAEGFTDVQWTYDPVPRLVCNGIEIRGEDHNADGQMLWDARPADTYHYRPTDFEYLYGIRMPQLSVFDPDGLLPLTLQRTELSGRKLPFKNELVRSVVCDLIAFLLVRGPVRPLTTKKAISEYNRLTYPGIVFPRVHNWPIASRLPLFSTEAGFAFADRWSLGRLQARPLTLVPFASPHEALPGYSFNRRYTIVLEPAARGEQAFRQWVRYALGYAEGGRLGIPEIYGARLLIRAVDADRLNRPRELSVHIRNALVEEKRENGWVLWSFGTCPAPSLNFDAIVKFPPSSASVYERVELAAEWYPVAREESPAETPFGKICEEILGTQYIPYDYKRRIERYGNHPELIDSVQRWLQTESPTEEDS
jgi:hypothetical protein